VLLYAVILLCLVIALLVWRGPEEKASFGSMEGRFDSRISLDYYGRTVRYRQNEITNYLLIGVDNEALGSAEYRYGGQADFLLLLSVDRRSRTVTPVMIDRDTMTPVTVYGAFGNPAGTRTMQICLAQAFGSESVTGSENTVKAVAGLLGGIRIDRCIAMDMSGINLLNDAVGGVTVTLEDDLSNLDPALRKGATVHLQGMQAEHFVRGRMTVADGTNRSRMKRQRQYVSALIDRMTDMFESGELSPADLLQAVSGHIRSDARENTLLSEANAYSSYEWKEFRLLPGEHALGDDGFMEYRTDEEALMDMIVDIWFK